MTKEQYIQKLIKMGYRVEGDTTYLETPYGIWIEKIVEQPKGTFGLISVKNPLNTLSEEK